MTKLYDIELPRYKDQPPVDETVATETYEHLLTQPQWITLRKAIIERDNHKCIICGRSDSLQVHHRQYHFVVSENRFKKPWDELVPKN